MPAWIMLLAGQVFQNDSGGGMRVMQWSEALSVGDVQIDADHRELFCLLDHLREAVRTGPSGPAAACM